MQIPQILSQFNPSQITEYLGNSNYILPLVGLFFVRFFLFSLLRSSLGLLLILAAVFLIFSTDPTLATQLSSFTGFNSSVLPAEPFGQNPWVLAGIFLLVVFFFRPQRITASSLLLLVVIGYLLFFRDFRLAALTSEGNWKTSLVGAGLLLIVIFLYTSRNRNRYLYPQQMNLTWVQPLLLGLALSFSALIIKNPIWLEIQLPGWRNSIGLAVLAGSCIAFFYNLPIKFRPYAISACWLFVIFTVYSAVQAH